MKNLYSIVFLHPFIFRYIPRLLPGNGYLLYRGTLIFHTTKRTIATGIKPTVSSYAETGNIQGSGLNFALECVCPGAVKQGSKLFNNGYALVYFMKP